MIVELPPWTVPASLGGSSSDAPTGSLLRVVQFNIATNVFHMELASDYASLYQPLDPDGDPDPTLLGNGFAAIELATDLAAFANPVNPVNPVQRILLPAPVSIDVSGHAVMELDISAYLSAYPLPLPSNITLPAPLFLRPAITTTYPDSDDFFLLYAER